MASLFLGRREERAMPEEVLKKLGNAVLEFDAQAAETWARKAIEEGVDPLAAFAALTEAIRTIGDLFQRGEYYLPELVSAAEVMQKAAPILEEKIKASGAERQSLGRVVVGTVFGDIHSIGKTMVSTLLAADGFDVIDLDVNVPAEEFVKAVKESDAQILALSALMTMTAPEMKKVIEQLQAEKLRQKVRVMVGGGAITAQFAKDIGADGYDATAPGAVRMARELLGI
jgi:methylmalonyl-CoA mutase cobalamin-binding domain/chain